MFDRFELLIGKDILNDISKKTVLIVGVGGVGGYTAVSLARSGVCNLIIIDFDIVDISNINRQVIAFHSTIGKKKVDVLEEMLKDINPRINVIKHDIFLNKDNIFGVFEKYNLDYVVDACDSVDTKKAIIKYCLDKEINFVSSMGTGNKFSPSFLSITDIRKTVNDPLARIMRKWVKDNKINKKIMVLSSSEQPKKTGRVVGSTSYVPASAGLMITSHIINDIIKKRD